MCSMCILTEKVGRVHECDSSCLRGDRKLATSDLKGNLKGCAHDSLEKDNESNSQSYHLPWESHVGAFPTQAMQKSVTLYTLPSSGGLPCESHLGLPLQFPLGIQPAASLSCPPLSLEEDMPVMLSYVKDQLACFLSRFLSEFFCVFFLAFL